MTDPSRGFAKYVVSRASLGGVLPMVHGGALPANSLNSDLGWSVNDDGLPTIWLQDCLLFLVSPDTEALVRFRRNATADTKNQTRLVLALAFFEFVIPVKDARLHDALVNSKALQISAMDGSQSVALPCQMAPYETVPVIPGAHIVVRL